MNTPDRYGLAFDAIVQDPVCLQHPMFLQDVVRKAAELAGMRLLHVVTSEIQKDLSKLQGETFADEGGISVVGLLSTSHIALHAWDERSVIMFDLVSCRSFDPEVVRKWIDASMGVTRVLHYALAWPTDAAHPVDGVADSPG